MPAVCFAKWAGSHWRGTAKRILALYPALPDDLADQVVEGISNVPNCEMSSDSTSQRIRAINRLIEEGHVRKAANVLLSDGVTPLDDDGLQRLQDLHPPANTTTKPFSPSQQRPNLRPVTPELIHKVIHRLPRDSAPGPSGWSFQIIRESYDKSSILAGFLKGLTAKMLRGECPLRSWFCASRLIPISKSGGGIRPIA